MGRMGGNNGDGQGGLMREEMDTPATNAEGRVPAPPPAINNQHERWMKGGDGDDRDDD